MADEDDGLGPHDSTTSLTASPQNVKKQASPSASDDLDDAPPFSLVTLTAVVKDGFSWKTQWDFLQLGMPGGLMMAAEASSFDITTALAGLLGRFCIK